jgi:hypothetical protein
MNEYRRTIDAVGDMVQLVRCSDLELEARVRLLKKAASEREPFELDAFQPGVQASVFQHALRRLNELPEWTANAAGWTETTDYEYEGSIRETRMASDAAAQRSVFIHKQKSAMKLDCEVWSLDAHAADVRVALARESVLSTEQTRVYKPADVKAVRIKRRLEHAHRHHLRADITEVRTGETRAAAEAAPPTFEVEIEVLRASELMRNHSNAAIAHMLVSAITSLLPPPAALATLAHQPTGSAVATAAAAAAAATTGGGGVARPYEVRCTAPIVTLKLIAPFLHTRDARTSVHFYATTNRSGDADVCIKVQDIDMASAGAHSDTIALLQHLKTTQPPIGEQLCECVYDTRAAAWLVQEPTRQKGRALPRAATVEETFAAMQTMAQPVSRFRKRRAATTAPHGQATKRAR